jgi:catechol 2,3-dioxygenase-like lactoylglutathione lyase family enzyme
MTFDRPGNPAWTERVMNEPGLTHLSLSVADFDAAVDRVESLGGQVLVRQKHVAMVRDPDGQLLEILTKRYHDRMTAARA